MDINKLIQIIEAEVKRAVTEHVNLHEIANAEGTYSQGKNVLALFTGGYAKLSDALSQIELLINSSFSVDVVMSQSAVNVIGKDKIQKIDGIGKFICDPDPSISSLKLVQSHDFIIIPILTRNTASKVALGITDNLITNIIMQALISAIPTIAARNSADPSDADCPCIGMPNTPSALLKLAHNYLQKLESYGMKLVDVSEIAHVVLGNTNKPEYFKYKLITHEIIAGLPKNTKQITISKGTIVTPLAKDTAKEYGIEIIFA